MYENMTDEEISEELDKRYGDNWTINDLDPEDGLCAEFFRRLETGV